ncbi:MAG: glycerol-3-phosphate acyltransferase [Coriobacteriia bacterium]|nr:glycerol-3-phosphate acyltransferase [Coriobacteriia bacterium]
MGVVFPQWVALPTAWLAVLSVCYLIGSIPFAYIIVKLKTGEDITLHGTGNIGSMNVRRTTGSWSWFAVAVLCDGLKGLVPVAAIKIASGMDAFVPFGVSLGGQSILANLLPPIAVVGVVLGHNYSIWIAIIKRKFAQTGKGLATGAGALLVYDWRYFVVVLVVGLTVIFLTRYMMAGQVAAAFALPVASLVLRSPDWPFALFMGALVYAAHHKRFMGLLKGKEPRFYINDAMGPRG